MNHYDFHERLAWSDGFLDEGIAQILRARIPGCYDVEKASNDSDRNGTDYWALRHNPPSLSVDCKVRDKDYALKGKDDLALETWSVIDKKIGWTRDPSKRTDYILWFWTETGRFELVPFPALCKVFQRYWEEWRETFFSPSQDSGNWQSECVFVPRDVVKSKIADWCSGTLPARGEEPVYVTERLL